LEYGNRSVLNQSQQKMHQQPSWGDSGKINDVNSISKLLLYSAINRYFTDFTDLSQFLVDLKLA